MSSDTGRMTGAQFMFSVACFFQASALLTAFIAPVTRQDSWIVVLSGALLFLPYLLLFFSLMRRFPNKNLVEINDTVFGRVAGKIVSLLYLFFFLTLSALNLRDLVNFVKGSVLQATPAIVVFVVFSAVCAWSVGHGVKVVTRYSSFFVFVALAILVFVSLFTLNLASLENMLPVLEYPPIKYLQGTNIIMAIPFGELVVFLMVVPNIEQRGKKSMKYLLSGFAIGVFTLLTVIVRDAAVLGNTLSIFTLPSYETLQMVSLSPTLNRLEIFFSIVYILLFFFKVSFLYYVTVMTGSQTLGLKSFRPLVLVTGALIVVYAVIIFDSTVDHTAFGRQQAPIFWLIFEYLLPLITWVTIKVRRLPRAAEEAG